MGNPEATEMGMRLERAAAAACGLPSRLVFLL